MAFGDKLKKDKKFRDFVSTDLEKPKSFYHAGSITLNLLLSGKVDGGILSEKVSMLAAPKAHFKSIVAMIAAGNAQKRGEKILWLDAEFAFDSSTARMFGMDTSEEKLILIQDNSIENVRSIVMNLFDDYDYKTEPKVFVVVDSLGMMITSKTVNDALDGEDKVDMSVSQKKNNLSKLLLRVSGINKATIVMINHLYEDMKMHSTGAIGGGSGGLYSSSSILKITSKKKDKEGNEVKGNIFTAYTEKGRLAKENSKLTFLASYEEGINPWYGILDDAVEGGYVIKPSMGFYSRTCISEDKKFRESQIYNADFWMPIFKGTDFQKYLETKYSYDDSLKAETKIYDMGFSLEG